MVIITVAGLFSSFWFSWSGIIPLIASIGGMVVFAGLWIEWEADEEERNHRRAAQTGAEKEIEEKSNLGWKVLMAGILVEIGCGFGLAVRGEWETWRSDPWNGNIADISADVYFEVRGTNVPNRSVPFERKYPLFLALCDRSPGYPMLGSTIVPLNADSFSFSPSITSADVLPPGGTWASTNASYSMHFGPVRGIAALKVGSNDIRKVREVRNVRFLWMQLDCVPEESQILGGTALVVINGKIELKFQIFRQSPHTEGTTRGVVIATNALVLK